MSAELQWLLIRNSSSFLIRRKGVSFTTEPHNLKNKNSFKYCGLVNRKTIGVTYADPRKKTGIVMTTKRRRNTRKPAAMYVNHQFQLKDRRRCYRSIRKFLGSTDYRQDLKEVAVRRASAIMASQIPTKRRLRSKKKH